MSYNPSELAYKNAVQLSTYTGQSNSVQVADAAAGPSGFVYLDCNISLSANTVLTATWVYAGGQFTNTGPYNLTIPELIAPNDVQIFDTVGTGTIIIDRASEISVCWFGVGFGTSPATDDTTALNRFITSVNSRYDTYGIKTKAIWPAGRTTYIKNGPLTTLPQYCSNWGYGHIINIQAQATTLQSGTRGVFNGGGNVGAAVLLADAANPQNYSVILSSGITGLTDGQPVLLAAETQVYPYDGSAGNNFQIGEVHTIQGNYPGFNLSGSNTVIPFREPVIDTYSLGSVATSAQFTQISAISNTFIASSGSWPSGIVATDCIKITGTGTANDNKLFSIISNSSGTLTVAPTPIPFSAQTAGNVYYNGQAELFVPTYINEIEFRGFEIFGNYITSGTEDLFALNFINNIKFIDCITHGASSHHFILSNCLNIEIAGCQADGVYYDALNGGDYYWAYLANGCQWFDVHDNKGTQFRHLTECSGHSGGAGYYGKSRFGHIHDNTIWCSQSDSIAYISANTPIWAPTLEGFGTIAAPTTSTLVCTASGGWSACMSTKDPITSGTIIQLQNTGTANDGLLLTVNTITGSTITVNSTPLTVFSAQTAGQLLYGFVSAASFAYETHGPGAQFVDHTSNVAWGANCLIRTENYQDGIVANNIIYGCTGAGFILSGSGLVCERLLFQNNIINSVQGGVTAFANPDGMIYINGAATTGTPIVQDITFDGNEGYNLYSTLIDPETGSAYNTGSVLYCDSTSGTVSTTRLLFKNNKFMSGYMSGGSAAPAPTNALEIAAGTGWNDLTFDNNYFGDWEIICNQAITKLAFYRNKFINSSIPVTSSKGWEPNAANNEAIGNIWQNFYTPLEILDTTPTNLRIQNEYYNGFTSGPITVQGSTVPVNMIMTECLLYNTTTGTYVNAQQLFENTDTTTFTIPGYITEVFDTITGAHIVNLPIQQQTFDYWDANGGSASHTVTFKTTDGSTINGTTGSTGITPLSTAYAKVHFSFNTVAGNWNASVG